MWLLKLIALSFVKCCLPYNILIINSLMNKTLSLKLKIAWGSTLTQSMGVAVFPFIMIIWLALTLLSQHRPTWVCPHSHTHTHWYGKKFPFKKGTLKLWKIHIKMTLIHYYFCYIWLQLCSNFQFYSFQIAKFYPDILCVWLLFYY